MLRWSVLSCCVSSAPRSHSRTGRRAPEGGRGVPDPGWRTSREAAWVKRDQRAAGMSCMPRRRGSSVGGAGGTVWVGRQAQAWNVSPQNCPALSRRSPGTMNACPAMLAVLHAALCKSGNLFCFVSFSISNPLPHHPHCDLAVLRALRVPCDISHCKPNEDGF